MLHAVLHAALHAALHAPDTLGCIVSLAGLRCFGALALVCRAWNAAVEAKARGAGKREEARRIASADETFCEVG